MHLTIRADGGGTIGYGHLVRTGALATEFLERGHEVTYATETPEAVEVVCPETIAIQEICTPEFEAFTAWLKSHEPDVVLLDVHSIATDRQAVVCDMVPVLATVLDDDNTTVCADVVINGNVYAPALNYDWIGAEPTWCLGTEYLLMRRTFRKRQRSDITVNDLPQRGLITMGGSDVRATSPVALRAFEATGLAVDVIIGPGFSSENRANIRRLANDHVYPIELHFAPTEQRLTNLMSRAEVAVSATGTTVYELLAMGTPTIGIPQSGNQIPVANALAERGAIRALPFGEQSEGIVAELELVVDDASMRRALQRAGRELVDGLGAERVYEVILDQAD